MSKYLSYRDTLNVTGLEFSLPINSIPKFEKLNENVSVNVSGLDEDGVVVPLHVTKYRGRQHHVNLLLLTKDVMDDGHSKTLYHYVLVKNLSRLLHSRTKHTGSTFPCPYCLHRCYTQQHLDKHLINCSTHKECKISFPSNKIKGRKEDEAVETLDELLGIDDDVRRGMELDEAEKDGTLPDNILHFKNIKAMQK